jgi:hypothetical protein
MNIAAGEPSGGWGMGMNFRKKLVPKTTKTSPRRAAVIRLRYFIGVHYYELRMLAR